MDCKLLEDRKYICIHTSGQGLLAQWGLLSFFIIIKVGEHWLWNCICWWLSMKVEKMVLLFREIGGNSGGTCKVSLPWHLRAGLVLRNLISLPLCWERDIETMPARINTYTCYGKCKCKVDRVLAIRQYLPCFRESQTRIRVVASELPWSRPRKLVMRMAGHTFSVARVSSPGHILNIFFSGLTIPTLSPGAVL